MLPEVKLKAKKQLGNLFAKENDGLSRHEKKKYTDLYGRYADRTNVLKHEFIQAKIN